MVLSLRTVQAKPEPAQETYDPVPQLAELAAAQAYEAELDAWIGKLVMQESGGRSTFRENGGLPYIIDVNGLRSWSCLQFQEPTFRSYSERHGIAGHISDCEVQKRLARAMIRENPKNANHWLLSTRKIGSPPVL